MNPIDVPLPLRSEPMKKQLLILFISLISSYNWAQSPFISEFHYDNTGVDIGETVEVTIPANCNCTSIEIVGYDGDTGAQYQSWTASSVIMNIEQYITVQTIGIENGGDDTGPQEPDGIALVCNGTLLQFISYEGSFQASNGIAQDEVSVDIGVFESETTESFESLQLTDSGWQSPSLSSFEFLNNGLSESQECDAPNGCQNIVVAFRSIMVNDPDDDDTEFFELIGQPNLPLTNLWLLEIDGDGVFVGDVDAAISLDGLSLGANGLLLYRRNANMLPEPSPETTVVTDPLFIPENRNLTFLLVEDFTGAVGSDLDTNNDGILEFTPWCNIADGLGIDEDDDPDIAPGLGFELINDNGGPLGEDEAMFAFADCSSCTHSNSWRGALVVNSQENGFSLAIDDGSWFHDGPPGTDCVEDAERLLTPGNTESPIRLVPTFTNNRLEFCEGDSPDPLPLQSDNNVEGTWTPSEIIDTSLLGETTYTFLPNSGQCATEVFSLTVFIEEEPNAGQLSVTSDQICIDDFTHIVSTDGTSNGSWSSSDPDIIQVDQAGSISPVGPGTAIISYTVPPSTLCGTNEESSSIEIVVIGLANPGMLSVPSPQLCIDDDTFVVTTNGDTTGEWSSSDTSILTVNESGMVTPIGAGIATVVYRIAPTTPCTTEVSSSIDLEVIDLPNAGTLTLSNSVICINDSDQTITTNGDDNGSWSSSDTNIVMVNELGELSPTGEGLATITYSVAPMSPCTQTDQASIQVEIIGASIVSFTGLQTNYCVGEQVTLPSIGDNVISGQWFNEMGNPVTELNTDLENNMLVYTFSPDDGQGCFTDTELSFNIEVCPCSNPPFVTIDPVTIACENEPISLHATLEGSASSITWTTNGLGSFDDSNSLSPVYTPNDSDTGTQITFTATTNDPDGLGACEEGIASITLEVNELVTPSFDEIPAQCAGEASPLPTSSNEGITGSWSPSFDPNTTQVYTFIPDENQCAIQPPDITVTIVDIETPTFEDITPQCPGESSPLPTVSLEGFTGNWSPIFDPNQTQQYTFIPDPDQCVATGINLTVVIQSDEEPTFSLIQPEYCFGDTMINLPNVSDNGLVGTWNTDTVDTNTIGTSSYTFTVSDAPCANQFELEITIEPCGCIVETMNQIEVCLGEELMINGELINTSQVGNTTVENLAIIDGQCDEKTVFQVNVIAPTVPSTLTPNGDGINDRLSILGTDLCEIDSYKLSIFNRWGEVVFESREISNGWSGSIMDQSTNENGLFIWSLEYNMNDIEIQQHGTVLVIN